MEKRMKLLAASMLMGVLLTGCGGSPPGKNTTSVTQDMAAGPVSVYTSSNAAGGIAQDSIAVSEEDYGYDEKAEGGAQGQTQDMGTMTLLEEKLVYHCDLEIETLDYVGTVTSIKNVISNYGGVIQSESESDSGRNWYYADYTKISGTMHNYLQVRIPSASYDSFLAELDGIGKILSKSTSVDNISQQYYDTATQIEALQLQEKSLLSMIEKCETIEDMIAVQDRLTQVQYELNGLQTDKRYMDIDVAYSYINISISEVMEYHYGSDPVKKNKFADRLANTVKAAGRSFLSFLEGLLFLVIMLFPYLVIGGVIGFLFRKKINAFLAGRKAEREARRAKERLRQSAAMQQPLWQTARRQDPAQQQEPQDMAAQGVDGHGKD